MADMMPRFPCWCKATYSWGGETKKDLGFIEGDLIEALNAGDGQWWMGRLRRDPRAIGLFPSNFVQVLDESFSPAPIARHASPSPQQLAPKPQPKPSFRKPFGSMDQFKKETTPEADKAERRKSFMPYASMKPSHASPQAQRKSEALVRDTSPSIPDTPPRRGQLGHAKSRDSINGGSRATARPVSMYDRPRSSALSREPSQVGYQAEPSHRQYGLPQHMYSSSHLQQDHRTASPRPDHRAPSPAPPRSHSPLPRSYHDGSAYPQMMPSSGPTAQYHQDNCHGYDPHAPEDEEDHGAGSPPPPPPPAHRVAYQNGRDQSPHSYDRQIEAPRTPAPPSPSAGSHMTPSPLRDAINDVMMSLQDMTVATQSPPPAKGAAPMDIWSPEEFELVRSKSRAAHRAQQARELQNRHQDRAYASHEEEPPRPQTHHDRPHVDDYAQSMDAQLEQRPFTSHAADCPRNDTQFSQPELRSKRSGYDLANRPTHFQQSLKHRKSAFELGHNREGLSRTLTTKTNATNSTESSSATHSSASTQITSYSLMSGASASGLSATSAGSLSRHKVLGASRLSRGWSIRERKSTNDLISAARSQNGSQSSGPSYHDSHASDYPPTPTADWDAEVHGSATGAFGGLGAAPKPKRSGFFKKMIETAKTTARTGAATARSTIASTSRPGSRAGSPVKSMPESREMTGFGNDYVGSVSSRPLSSAAAVPAAPNGTIARDMGLGNEWVQVRRDIHRSNSLSHVEMEDRAQRCELYGMPSLRPVEQLYDMVEGGEGVDGRPVHEPRDFNGPQLALVDRSTRFIQSVPPMVNAGALAQNHICRPHKSDVQRLRAIFTWVAERIAWEDDFEGALDTRRVVQTRRACSQEIALLVYDMCAAISIPCEVVRGTLKRPGEALDADALAAPNHWWNAVLADGEWRILDCALANPSFARRALYSSAGSSVADAGYFLARPLEICYTHIPLLPEQQHLVPPVPHELLAALPCATPAFFRQGLDASAFHTALLHLENLEMAHVHVSVPEDVECVAETEARAFALDADGDLFENGDTVKKPALAQVEWINGQKRYTFKAVLPGDEGHGALRIYAGKKGLMHSIRDNPHPLALALPLVHTGPNPPYNFVTRHPTPHAQRHDLYVVQPQCARLVLNNTFVFCVRQHPSSLRSGSLTGPHPLHRTASALSLVSAAATGSQYSDTASVTSSANGGSGQPQQQKPAKLAIQTPSQKILRLTRKLDSGLSRQAEENLGLTTSWETVIKIGERGTWRGLVLADRSARWCVFAEWVCE